MKDVNKVILIGRLGAHPELRITKNGNAMASFPLATQSWYSGTHRTEENPEGSQDHKKQNSKRTVEWHRIVAWGKIAEICGRYLKKGSPIYLEGAIRQRSYQDPSGQQRWVSEIHTFEISMLGKKPELTENPKSSSPEVEEQESAAFGSALQLSA